MQIYGNNRKRLHKKRVKLRKILLVHQYGQRFIISEHRYGSRDIMWNRSYCKQSFVNWVWVREIVAESQELNFPFSFLVVINFTISREYFQ